MKRKIVTVCLAAGLLQGLAQETGRYRVSLADKAATECSLSAPEAFLSAKALQRRARQGLPLDSADLPVCRSYAEAVAEKGAKVVLASKWNNTLLVECADTACMAEVARLPFVRHIRKVGAALPPADSLSESDRKKEVADRFEKKKERYGMASCQARMLGVDTLHALGFRGQGMTVAVLDAGFRNADAVKLLAKARIAGTRNFVDSADVFAGSDHGLKVLSCMAADRPGVLVGTAPEASYWLLCSEESGSESPAEEDRWAAAVEFADSVGADVVNSSLGYFAFDDPSGNYAYPQLDGRVSLASRSASVAAAKGMVVVCSAGNEGNGTWKKITPPADADGVLAVGAVDAEGLNAPFSSVGPAADGRVKPDVMAMGKQAAVVGPEGCPERANGTSFAAPVLCGAVVCLWQACPHLTARQVTALVRQAGSRAGMPDNVFGYGIPDFRKAWREAQLMQNR